jgi:hypothetical protein
VGYFGELTKVFNQAWTAAKKDISAGKYATINVLTCALPLLFLGCSALLALLPSGDEEPPKMRMSKPVVQESASSLPKEVKSSDKKED